MKRFLLLTMLLPLFSSSQDLAAKADELLTAYHQQGKFTGTVLLAKGGKIVFEKGYGYADLQAQSPNTAHTEFRIGSLSKTFTATIVLQLQEQGKLNITDPIRKYLADYPKGDSITIEQLLNHTSGIRSITSMKAYYDQWIAEPATLDQTIDHIKHEPLSFAPGSRYEYSNSNYILLSRIAEVAGGQPYPQLLQSLILQPLRMQQSGLDQNNRVSANRAIGYATTPADSFAVARYNDMSVLAGAGAMYSTARDLYAWDRAWTGNSLLSEASRKKMLTPAKNKYGLGWEIDQVNGRQLISHSGSIDGYLSNMMRFPDEDVCIIFLSNYFQSKGPQISRALTAIMFNEPYQLPVERKAIALDHKVYQLYAGQYQMEKGPALQIVYEEGKLKGKLGNQPYFEMLPEAETRFFIKGMDGDVEFMKDESKIVTAVALSNNGKTLHFKRVPAAQ